MDKEQMKMMFCVKLTSEIKDFKESILKLKSNEVMTESYCIMCKLSIYEMLVEMSETFEVQILYKLEAVQGLIDFLYECWLKTEDSFQQDLEESISRSICALCNR